MRTITTAGTVTNLWWLLAGIFICGDVAWKTWQVFDPHIVYMRGILHAASLAAFAAGWAVRKTLTVPDEPRGNYRFIVNRLLHGALVLLILPIGVVAGWGRQLFPDPHQLLLADEVALASGVVLVVLGQTLKANYFRLLNTYGICRVV